jgi:hypothetical protein
VTFGLDPGEGPPETRTQRWLTRDDRWVPLEARKKPPLGALLRLGGEGRQPEEYVEVVEHGALGIRLARGKLRSVIADWPPGTRLQMIAFEPGPR